LFLVACSPHVGGVRERAVAILDSARHGVYKAVSVSGRSLGGGILFEKASA
jgi:hypothetical protein